MLETVLIMDANYNFGCALQQFYKNLVKKNFNYTPQIQVRVELLLYWFDLFAQCYE